MFIYLAGFVCTDAFEHADQVNRPTIRGFACRHRAATDEDSGDVQANCSHQHSRNDLVAIWDADHSVKSVRGDDCFNRIRNEFTAGEGVVHAHVPHRDAIIYANGIKFKRHATCCPNRFLDETPKFLQVDVARNDVNVTVANGNEGFRHVFIANPSCL